MKKNQLWMPEYTLLFNKINVYTREDFSELTGELMEDYASIIEEEHIGYAYDGVLESDERMMNEIMYLNKYLDYFIVWSMNGQDCPEDDIGELVKPAIFDDLEKAEVYFNEHKNSGFLPLKKNIANTLEQIYYEIDVNTDVQIERLLYGYRIYCDGEVVIKYMKHLDAAQIVVEIKKYQNETGV